MTKDTIDYMATRDIGDFSCEIIGSFKNIDQALEKEWDELAVKTKGSIYLTCAWTRVWWEFYGKAKALRVFIFRCEGKLVGIMPIYIEEIRIGLVRTRIARLVGAYNPPRVFDVPINKEYAAAVGDNLVRHLIEQDQCDVISIGPVSDECEAQNELFSSLEKMTDKIGILKTVLFGVYTHFELPDTYDTYLKSLSSNERRRSRRYYQKLFTNNSDVHLTVLKDPNEIEAEMPRFFALHKAQWQVKGRLGYFAAWPQSDDFNHRLAVEMAHLGRTSLIKVTFREIPILYLYSYNFGNCCYAQQLSRATGEEWDRFSLGKTVLVVLIQKTIEEGIKRIESGLSHYDYKTRLGAKDSCISVLRIVPRRPKSAVKYYLFIVFHKLYENLYYKLWYKRIQPRFPSIFHRPVWVGYTRTIF